VVPDASEPEEIVKPSIVTPGGAGVTMAMANSTVTTDEATTAASSQNEGSVHDDDDDDDDMDGGDWRSDDDEEEDDDPSYFPLLNYTALTGVPRKLVDSHVESTTTTTTTTTASPSSSTSSYGPLETPCTCTAVTQILMHPADMTATALDSNSNSNNNTSTTASSATAAALSTGLLATTTTTTSETVTCFQGCPNMLVCRDKAATMFIKMNKKFKSMSIYRGLLPRMFRCKFGIERQLVSFSGVENGPSGVLRAEWTRQQVTEEDPATYSSLIVFDSVHRSIAASWRQTYLEESCD
jgi:hypothetical protein